FASDNTGSPRTRGAAQNSPSAQASSADLRSVLATAHTSSPDPLAGGTYSVPSIASASVTAHSSSSISFAPPLTCTTLTPPPKSTAPKHTPNPQTSSPDPLTWTSPSMHLNHNNHHPTSHQTPTNTNPQKILFTKPTPFAGRHASKTTIHTPYGYNEPLHLGRNITGACSKFKVRRPKVKAKEKGGKAKGRRGQSKSAGHGRADRGRVSVYNLPDSEDGGGGREGEDEEDVEAIEDIE
ncbi:MAG: hypothetical protein M1830_005754, partial [Pleopsidium flavum]